MTAKRQPDGTTVYRNQRIKLNPDIRPGKMGRYSWNGRPFTLLAHARAAVDDHLREYEEYCRDMTARESHYLWRYK